MPRLPSLPACARRFVAWAVCFVAVCVLATVWCGPVPVRADDPPQPKPAVRKSAEQLLARADDEINRGNHKVAEALLTKVLAAQKIPTAYYLRGRERFRLGRVAESVGDFDQYVKLQPKLESRQWERGIAYYYNGQFKEGAKQFELYQTYHDNDVENSVWRYLCMARTEGVKKAQAVMLPIKNDRRVPMMQVFRLYRGELKPADVLKAVDADKPPAEVRGGRMFYAHLYLGLYYEAQGDGKLARKYIYSASDNYKNHPRINHYMWDVAHIHAQQLRRQDAKGEGKQGKDAKGSQANDQKTAKDKP